MICDVCEDLKAKICEPYEMGNKHTIWVCTVCTLSMLAFQETYMKNGRQVDEHLYDKIK